MNSGVGSVAWHRSSHSGEAGTCVEIAAISPERRAVRDSKDFAGGVLAVSDVAWGDFVAAVMRGEFPQA